MMNQGGLSIVRQLPVGTRERVVIVQAGEEQFLVGVTSQSVQLISKLETPLNQEELGKSALANTPFATQLTQILKKKMINTNKFLPFILAFFGSVSDAVVI